MGLCKFVSPQKTLFSGLVKSIILPVTDGEIQILPGHAESFFLLTRGKIILEKKEEKKELLVLKGVFYISDDNAISLILTQVPKR